MATFNLYNADGSLQFSLSNRLARYIGSASVGTGSGSLTVPTTGGAVWAYFALTGSSQFAQKKLRITGAVVSWTVYVPDGASLNLLYGEY